MHLHHRPRVVLNDEAARAFLARSLRRYLAPVERWSGEEDYELAPGFDPLGDDADAGDVERLVYQACWAQPPVIAMPAGMELDLLVDTDPDDGWMYAWRISFPSGVPFALVSPYRHEFRKIGRAPASPPASKALWNAMAVLTEAAEEANRILAGYYRSAGHARPGRWQRRRWALRHARHEWFGEHGLFARSRGRRRLFVSRRFRGGGLDLEWHNYDRVRYLTVGLSSARRHRWWATQVTVYLSLGRARQPVTDLLFGRIPSARTTLTTRARRSRDAH